MRELRIGQIGWGTVGSAFGRVVEHGSVPVRLACLAVRDAHAPRREPLPAGVPVVSPEEVVADASVDAVVELAGGTDAPLRWAHATLSSGRAYVTANKALLATCGGELASVARSSGGALLGSASVGGGTPMIEMVQHLAAAGGIARLRGVLNATTTYILSRMSDGVSYRDALSEAQEAGYAEADPSFDVEGRDAAQKLAILASVAWRRWCGEAEVARSGIGGIGVDPGATVRLVAEGLPDRLSVRPMDVGLDPADAPLAAASGIENVLEVETDAGVFRISGPGAGGDVTARAVYADVSRLAAGERPVLFA